MNVWRVAVLLLIFLLSQHALASTRIIHAIAGDSPCADLPTDCLHHCHHYDVQNSDISTSHSHYASIHQYEHHCEFCIGGCQTLMFSSVPLSVATHSFYINNKKTSLSIPFEPITNLYRPPIQLVAG